MTSLDRRAVFALLVLAHVPGCWLSEPPAPPPFDCANIDRADERFPDECGDAGVPEDLGTDSDAEVDAGP